jgi:hypothetical protein
MKKVLRLKAWKLFLILFASIFASIIVETIKLNIGGLNSAQLAALFNIIGLIIFFLWLMLLGLQINKIKEIPYHFSNLLLVLATISATSTYIEMNLQVLLKEYDFIPFYIGFILMPFTIWGLIYIFSRIPKSLNSIENKRIVKSSEYLKDSLLLFIFPIGVWFIQPRINKIAKEEKIIIK